MKKKLGTHDAKANRELDNELLEKLAPSGLIGVLVDLRILEPQGAGLRLRPWIESLAISRVLDDLLRARGRELGEALLRPHAAPLVLTRLHAAFMRGDFAPLEDALVRLDRTDPASVSMLEGAFRAAGIAVLQGAAPPIDLLRRAWDCQFEAAMAARPNGALPPVPLLYWPGEGHWLHMGTWFLACLAISEKIQAATPVEFAYWTGDSPVGKPPGYDYVTRQIEAAISVWGRPVWWLDAFDLGRRLVERGVPLPAVLGEMLVVPAVVSAVRLAKPLPLARDIRWVIRDGRSGLLDALRDQARRVRVPVEDVLRALWEGYAQAGPPLDNLYFDDRLSDDEKKEVWRVAPTKLFADKERLFPVMLDGRGVPREATTLEQWRAFLSAWSAESGMPFFGSSERTDVWWVMPDDVLEEAARNGKLSNPALHDLRAVAWTKAPARLVELGLEWVREGLLDRVLNEAPPEYWGRFLGAVRERLPQGSEAEMANARIWLHLFITRREQGWREAFALLEEIRRPSAKTDATT